MPLILLGLIVVIGIVIYGLVIYGRSGDDDTRPVRERYPHVFPPKQKDDGNDDDDDPDPSGPKHTMYFPTDAEVEKRKRNIH